MSLTSIIVKYPDLPASFISGFSTFCQGPVGDSAEDFSSCPYGAEISPETTQLNVAKTKLYLPTQCTYCLHIGASIMRYSKLAEKEAQHPGKCLQDDECVEDRLEGHQLCKKHKEASLPAAPKSQKLKVQSNILEARLGVS